MSNFPSKAWYQRLQQRVNQDQDFKEAARWFNGTVGWRVDDQQTNLGISGQQVADLSENGDDIAFGMSGSLEVWRELLAKGTINRLYRQGKIQILGDKVEAMRFWKVLWYLTENARAL